MAEYRLGRSEYWFDPTATEAVARADRRTSTAPPTGNIYHASPADLAKISGFVFEPDRPISNSQLRRMRFLRKIAEKTK